MQRKHEFGGVKQYVAPATSFSENSFVEISGMAKVTVTGNIKKGISFELSGLGQLTIDGEVDETVKFNLSGQSKLIFLKYPPSNVIRNTERQGLATVSLPTTKTSELAPTSRTPH